VIWSLVLAGCASAGGIAPDAAFEVTACEVSQRVGLVVVDVAEPPYTVRATVWRTDDGGATWSRTLSEDLSQGPLVARDDEVWMAAHLRRAGVFAVLYRSTDAGLTWTTVEPPPRAESPEIDALAFTEGGLSARVAGTWSETADGTTWTPSPPGDGETCARGTWLRVTPAEAGWTVERRVKRTWRTAVEVPRYVVAP
jgi:photosystem II stability/assembly factor-like uncharacterized protein